MKTKGILCAIVFIAYAATVLILAGYQVKYKEDIEFLADTVVEVHAINKQLTSDNEYLMNELAEVVREREELKAQLEFSRSLQFKYNKKASPINLCY